jgi:hypothetical protein
MFVRPFVRPFSVNIFFKNKQNSAVHAKKVPRCFVGGKRGRGRVIDCDVNEELLGESQRRTRRVFVVLHATSFQRDFVVYAFFSLILYSEKHSLLSLFDHHFASDSSLYSSVVVSIESYFVLKEI